MVVCLEVNGADVRLCVCLFVFLEKNTAFLGHTVAFFGRDVLQKKQVLGTGPHASQLLSYTLLSAG